MQPDMQRDMARLENHPDFDRERLSASAAIPQAWPGRLALHLGRLIYGAAMWANRAIGPKPRLDILDRGILTGKMDNVESGFHGDLPC